MNIENKGTKIIVKNLTNSSNTSTLYDFFIQYGDIADMKVTDDGNAVIEFTNSLAVTKCLAAGYSDYELDDIVVEAYGEGGQSKRCILGESSTYEGAMRIFELESFKDLKFSTGTLSVGGNTFSLLHDFKRKSQWEDWTSSSITVKLSKGQRMHRVVGYNIGRIQSLLSWATFDTTFQDTPQAVFIYIQPKDGSFQKEDTLNAHTHAGLEAQQNASGLDELHSRNPVTGADELNDLIIIIFNYNDGEFGKDIYERAKSLELNVGIYYPSLDKEFFDVLSYLKENDIKYCIHYTDESSETNTVVMYILHGVPVEHKNIPLTKAFLIMEKDYRENFCEHSNRRPVPSRETYDDNERRGSFFGRRASSNRRMASFPRGREERSGSRNSFSNSQKNEFENDGFADDGSQYGNWEMQSGPMRNRGFRRGLMRNVRRPRGFRGGGNFQGDRGNDDFEDFGSDMSGERPTGLLGNFPTFPPNVNFPFNKNDQGGFQGKDQNRPFGGGPPRRGGRRPFRGRGGPMCFEPDFNQGMGDFSDMGNMQNEPNFPPNAGMDSRGGRPFRGANRRGRRPWGDGFSGPGRQEEIDFSENNENFEKSFENKYKMDDNKTEDRAAAKLSVKDRLGPRPDEPFHFKRDNSRERHGNQSNSFGKKSRDDFPNFRGQSDSSFQDMRRTFVDSPDKKFNQDRFQDTKKRPDMHKNRSEMHDNEEDFQDEEDLVVGKKVQKSSHDSFPSMEGKPGTTDLSKLRRQNTDQKPLLPTPLMDKRNSIDNYLKMMEEVPLTIADVTALISYLSDCQADILNGMT